MLEPSPTLAQEYHREPGMHRAVEGPLQPDRAPPGQPAEMRGARSSLRFTCNQLYPRGNHVQPGDVRAPDRRFAGSAQGCIVYVRCSHLPGRAPGADLQAPWRGAWKTAYLRLESAQGEDRRRSAWHV